MTKVCTVEGCERPHRCKGYCGKHYERFRTYGDPLGHAITRSPLAAPQERFWAKVQKTDTCWNWTGAHKSGHGHFRIDGRYYRAHRLSYEWLVGPIPDGLHLDHLCRNRACVNPAHLEPVTPAENNARGESLSAQRMRQTHCHDGHEFTPENTHIDSLGRRNCRACGAARAREYRKRAV